MSVTEIAGKKNRKSKTHTADGNMGSAWLQQPEFKEFMTQNSSAREIAGKPKVWLRCSLYFKNQNILMTPKLWCHRNDWQTKL